MGVFATGVGAGRLGPRHPFFRRLPLMLGLLALACVWLGPLPQLASHLFAAHMAMHVTVVALAAPLLSAALAGGRLDPVRRWPRAFAPVPLSIAEFAVVWAWHAPALHHLSRTQGWAMALEQGSFLVAGFALWVAAFGGHARQRALRRAGGILALLMTSMHMTLLGVLLATAPRVLYGHVHGVHALQDQQLGGVLMLAGGGISYLAGALYLLTLLLVSRVAADNAGQRTRS